MSFVAKTDIGKIRVSNEDACNTGAFTDGSYFAVVCDGMGGVSGGEIASDIVCKTVSGALEKGYREKMNHISLKNLMESAICTSNIKVNDFSKADVKYYGMGTTVVCAVVSNGYAVIAHVGDSRAYIIHKDGIEQITKDHSVVQYMVDNGVITKEEARFHPKRNIITRAVGVDRDVEVDIDFVGLSDGDRLLVCTDGLTGCVTDAEMLEISQAVNDPENLCDELIKKALSGGGHDNITVAVAFC